MKNNNERIGLTVALIDMFIFGMIPVFTHYFVSRMSPLLFGGITSFAASIPLIGFLVARGKFKELFSPKYFKSLFIISTLGAFGSMVFVIGAKLTSGINTGLLLQIEPLYALIIAFIVLKEKVVPQQIAAVSLMVIGAIVIVYKGFTDVNIGDLMILLCPIPFQISHLITKKIYKDNADVYLVPTARLFYGGVILTFFAIITDPGSVKDLIVPENLIAVMVYGLFIRSLDLILWYQALSKLEVSKASALIPLAAIVSFLGAMIFLGEKASYQQFLGMVFIFLGLIWLSYVYIQKNKKAKIMPDHEV